ncbi:hypothetical protein AAFF_G00369120 [Aldrovandia affinis]|uniref:Uncharacterized protein n=1 Tax=Aldrovandia affinis TaxID=143900 RepID=A0AAD7SHE7_9TELE|nr:hypothetical protein AAFF_G00369120 [Aldrovandia affinis]
MYDQLGMGLLCKGCGAAQWPDGAVLFVTVGQDAISGHARRGPRALSFCLSPAQHPGHQRPGARGRAVENGPAAMWKPARWAPPTLFPGLKVSQ